MLNGKAKIVLIIVGLIKKTYINEWVFSRTKIFWKKSESWIKFIKLCNKSRFKKRNRCWNAISKFVKKVDLASLKSDVEKLDIDKLKDV